MNYSFNNNYLYTFNHYFTQDSGNGGPPHVKTTERVNRNRKTVHEFHHWFATTNVLFNLIKRDRFQPKALSTVFNIPFVEDAADETPAGCAIPVRFAPRDGREKTIGRRTEERMRRKTITVHRWKLFFVNQTPCTRFFSIEITMRLTSKPLRALHENKRERDKRKTKNDQTTRRRKYGREGEGFEKLNWTLTKDPRVWQWIVTHASMFANGRCRYWFFSAVFHPYRAISNRERRAQNRHVFFHPSTILRTVRFCRSVFLSTSERSFRVCLFEERNVDSFLWKKLMAERNYLRSLIASKCAKSDCMERVICDRISKND